MTSTRAGKVATYHAALRALNEQDGLRRLAPRSGIDFGSNDYLALASAPRIKKAMAAALESGTPIGAGGSRLLRGNCDEHERLELEAAHLFGAETALFFSDGYVANFAILLPQRGDLLVLDSLVHASIHEGARSGRAEFRESAHNAPTSVENTIRDWRVKGGTGRVWIVAESLYSTDGDFAPLKELVAIADRHDAFLLVDEAHATGVYGEQGKGLTAPLRRAREPGGRSSVRKALGAAGALVTASRVLRDFMVNRLVAFTATTRAP
ncbi:aminotransferase class I/II-fold pyridoxal phosphate-dependent enzyme [Bradyrhizobium ottawaense]|uniref:aminotransferase class I/II-fold pyridoxal phosphate-dependent enzyme n=1 Tax=Bradyrhizobium ottawaense TaxID=931866 RepID=UPI001FDF0F37|nr:aminotransferase class I/II-fold pyridoxal phosphate-dependent enzyme [Bradyrhizobium ottawaense]